MNHDMDDDEKYITLLQSKVECSREVATHLHYTLLNINEIIMDFIEKVSDNISYNDLELMRKLLLTFTLVTLKDYETDQIRMASDTITAMWDEVLPVGEKMVLLRKRMKRNK